MHWWAIVQFSDSQAFGWYNPRSIQTHFSGQCGHGPDMARELRKKVKSTMLLMLRRLFCRGETILVVSKASWNAPYTGMRSINQNELQENGWWVYKSRDMYGFSWYWSTSKTNLTVRSSMQPHGCSLGPFVTAHRIMFFLLFSSVFCCFFPFSLCKKCRIFCAALLGGGLGVWGFGGVGFWGGWVSGGGWGGFGGGGGGGGHNSVRVCVCCRFALPFFFI